MNREFVFRRRRASAWSRAGATLSRWLWGALCCGLPGIPCYYCTCCEKYDVSTPSTPPRINQATATAERARARRPHTPGGRKSAPELLTAVKCALSQLQGEPAPQQLLRNEIKQDKDPG